MVKICLEKRNFFCVTRWVVRGFQEERQVFELRVVDKPHQRVRADLPFADFGMAVFFRVKRHHAVV